MHKRFKPLLATAVAAGAIPLIEPIPEAHAAVVTVAGFNFETQTATGFTNFPVSYLADVWSPGYGGSMTASLSNTAGAGWRFDPGNGSAKSLGSNTWLAGGFYNFGFDIDDVEQLVIRFDMRSSGTGPGQFIVVAGFTPTFTAISTVTLATNVFSSSTSQTALSFSVAMPANFSDQIPGFAGQSAYIRLLAVTSVGASGGTVANAGINDIDNIFITGQTIPEPSAMVMTLAAAAGLVTRGKRRDD